MEFVGQASNAHDAIEAVLKLKLNVVILDIRLAGGNGIKVHERIEKEHPSSAVIMLTSYTYPPYREKCRQLRAGYFFDKVTEIESFVKCCKCWLRIIIKDNCRRDPDGTESEHS